MYCKVLTATYDCFVYSLKEVRFGSILFVLVAIYLKDDRISCPLQYLITFSKINHLLWKQKKARLHLVSLLSVNNILIIIFQFLLNPIEKYSLLPFLLRHRIYLMHLHDRFPYRYALIIFVYPNGTPSV